MGRLALTSAALVSLLLACVPAVDSAPQLAAEAYCQRAADCGWVSEDELEGCEESATASFEGVWTTTTCEDGFERDGWSECIETIDTLDCGDTIVLGWGDINDACRANSICI